MSSPTPRFPLRSFLAGARLLTAIPRFVRRPLTEEAALELVQRGLRQRRDVFLAAAKAIYSSRDHPVFRLLEHAGVELEDIRKQLGTSGPDGGVEGTLRALRAAGVYVTVDEYKGFRPVRRGSLTIHCTPASFRNQDTRVHVRASTGGSRSDGTPVLIDLDFVRACAASNSVSLQARDGTRWEKILWELPGAGARFRQLKKAGFGRPPVAWFTQTDVDGANAHPMFRRSERAMRCAARIGGVRLPAPQLAAVDRPLAIAEFLRDRLEQGKTPHVLTFASSAVRLADTALEEQIDLTGAQFTLGGEPVTAARLQRIREVGIHGWPRYGSMECGPVGYPCVQPDRPDSVHLQDHLHALIQAEGDCPGLPERALLITSLHPRAPFRFFNVAMGDQASLQTAPCGCPMQRLGFDRRLAEIASYEKLTAGGMTFFDGDVVRTLEELLPSRFGGGPADYQLEELIDEQGNSRLLLRVHPRLGRLDTSLVREAFMNGVCSASIVDVAMGEVWDQLGVLEIQRLPPKATQAAKILHVVSSRTTPPNPAPES